MRRNRGLLAALMITLLLSLCVPQAGALASTALIREGEVETLFAEYCAEHDLDPGLISIAYLYTETGETWYHQEDRWYYSASLYKVPLMMLLTEQEYEGILTGDSLINGIPLRDIEEEVLVQSNNPVAYSTLLYFGTPDATRKMFCRYSSLPEDYFIWDFYGGSYFTARYMTDVMYTLFREPDRFPRMIDCLERAQPGHYFRLRLEGQLMIAQKYGTYQDEDGTDWNHTAGIISTPHPFILTVMTKYGGISETILGDLAVLFRDYTFQLDERLASSLEQADNSLAQQETEAAKSEKPKTVETKNGESAHQAALEAEPTVPEIPLTEKDPSVAEPAVGRGTLLLGEFGLELVLVLLLFLQKIRKHTAFSFSGKRKRVR